MAFNHYNITCEWWEIELKFNQNVNFQLKATLFSEMFLI